jgi:hypothetical protein
MDIKFDFANATGIIRIFSQLWKCTLFDELSKIHRSICKDFNSMDLTEDVSFIVIFLAFSSNES